MAKPARDEQGFSFECPKCEGPTRVLDSRPVKRPHVAIRRRRVCKSCNLRFTTYELVEEQIREVKVRGNALSALRQARDVLDTAIRREGKDSE